MSSIKDVAREAGVSVATVSHVINRTRFVREDTKQKVLEVMNKLNYTPNQLARGLRNRKTNTVGLLISRISNFFYTQVAEGIENTLRMHGYNIILSNSNENLENEKKQLENFNAQMINGLILTPSQYEYDYSAKLLQDLPYPVVIFDCKPKGYEGDSVLVDNEQGSYEAIRLLIEKGHERIGTIAGGLHLATSIERLAGYKKAMQKHGLPVHASYIKIGQDTGYETGYQLAKEFVEEGRVTAIFVCNNLMSIGALKYLKEKNIKIPDEIAIIGFDDYLWASITDPPLTVVKQPVDEIGKRAAELLINRMNGEESEGKEIRLPTRLVIRKSC